MQIAIGNVLTTKHCSASIIMEIVIFPLNA